MVTTSAATGGSSRKRLPFSFAATGDERLAALVAAGNERAFAAIYSRYHQPLYRYCLTMVRHESDAQDALQSALAAALTALREGRRTAPLRPWLFRIAHNEAISLLRRRRPEAPLSEIAEYADVGVEERAGQRDEFQMLIADLRELPDRQRAALVMRELSGLSHEDIALALEVSTAAAKQTIFEARRSLMEFVAGREASCDEIRGAISDGDGRAVRARRVRAHLRSCAGCTTFADQLRRRRSALRVLAPPLPVLLAKELLGRVLHSSGTHGGGTVATAGAAGKLTTAALSAKSVAGVAIVLSAGAGVGGLLHAALHHQGSGRPHSVKTVRAAGPFASRSTGGAAVSGSLHARRIASATGLAGSPASRLRHGGRSGSASMGTHPRAVGKLSASAGTAAASVPVHGNAGSHGHAGAHGQSSTHGQSSSHGQSSTHGRSSTHGQGSAHAHSPTGSQGHGNAGSRTGNGSARVTKHAGSHTPTATGGGNGSGSSHAQPPHPTPVPPPGKAGTSGGGAG